MHRESIGVRSSRPSRSAYVANVAPASGASVVGPVRMPAFFTVITALTAVGDLLNVTTSVGGCRSGATTRPHRSSGRGTASVTAASSATHVSVTVHVAPRLRSSMSVAVPVDASTVTGAPSHSTPVNSQCPPAGSAGNCPRSWRTVYVPAARSPPRPATSTASPSAPVVDTPCWTSGTAAPSVSSNTNGPPAAPTVTCRTASDPLLSTVSPSAGSERKVNDIPTASERDAGRNRPTPTRLAPRRRGHVAPPTGLRVRMFGMPRAAGD